MPPRRPVRAVMLTLFASVAVLFTVAGYAAATPTGPDDGVVSPTTPTSSEPTATPSAEPTDGPAIACDTATVQPSASPPFAPARLLLADKKVCVLIRVEVTQDKDGKSSAKVKETRVSDGGEKPEATVQIDPATKKYIVEIKYGTALKSCDKDTRFLFFDNGVQTTLNPEPGVGLTSFETWIFSAEAKKPFKYTKEESFFYSVTCTRP